MSVEHGKARIGEELGRLVNGESHDAGVAARNVRDEDARKALDAVAARLVVGLAAVGVGSISACVSSRKLTVECEMRQSQAVSERPT